MGKKITIQERFERTHAKHPEIYREFRRLALYLRNERHFRRYSADGIFHVIRFQRIQSMTDTEGFKISNDLISRYVRMLIKEDDSFADFFTVRELRAA